MGNIGHPHHRIEEIRRIWTDNEFLVEALLANLDVELVAKFLLIPELPESDGREGLDTGHSLQVEQVALAEKAAPNMEAADVERAPAQTERFLGVQLHRHGGEPIFFEALPDAADQIAEHLSVFEYAQRDSVLGQAGRSPPMSPRRFEFCQSPLSTPQGPALAGFEGAEASARNCSAASCGKAKGAGFSALEGSAGTTPAPAGDCADGFESDAAGPGFKGGMESAKAAPANPAITRVEALRNAARRRVLPARTSEVPAARQAQWEL